MKKIISSEYCVEHNIDEEHIKIIIIGTQPPQLEVPFLDGRKLNIEINLPYEKEFRDRTKEIEQIILNKIDEFINK